jgi:hypothetical protein
MNEQELGAPIQAFSQALSAHNELFHPGKEQNSNLEIKPAIIFYAVCNGS